MNLVATPIEMISDPNFYSIIEDGYWTLIGSNAQTLWLRVDIKDSLGQRPYMISNTDTLKVEFLRADQFSTPNNRSRLQSTAKSVEKPCLASATNRSLYKIILTSNDVGAIMSGSARFTITSGGSSNTWVMNYAVVKKLTDPGF